MTVTDEGFVEQWIKDAAREIVNHIKPRRIEPIDGPYLETFVEQIITTHAPKGEKSEFTETLKLGDRDRKTFLDALLDPPAPSDALKALWQVESPKQQMRRRVNQYKQRIPCGKCGHVHLGSCSICNNCEQIEPPRAGVESPKGK